MTERFPAITENIPPKHMMHIIEKHIKSNGLEIYHDVIGAPANHSVICLHGLASNATRWHEFMSQTSLHNISQIIAPDLRGHGRSMTRKAYQRQQWCEDLDTLVKGLNTPCTLIGHSMGGQIALEYAVRNPESLAGMVLIDPVFPQALTGTLKKIARFRFLLRIVITLLRVLQLTGIYKRHFPKRSLWELDRQTREFLARNPDREIAELYMDPFADLKFIPLVNYLQDLVEVTRPLPLLDSIAIPTLVLLSQGASTSNVEINRKILGTLTDCEIHPIPADHWLLTEKPAEARTAIENWFEKHGIVK